MTGLDYKRSSLSVREKFAVTRAMSAKLLASFKDKGIDGCVIISTCNRTELYASISDGCGISLSKILCAALELNFSKYESCFTERDGDCVIEHLCSVASGLDSQIIGDDQIITQAREALEFSREQKCTDSHIETMFNLSICAAKVIKTKVLANSLGTSSVPEKTVDKIKTMYNLVGRNVLIIGNGRIGKMVSELLIREGMNVTVTLRSHNRGVIQIIDKADVINYDERYKAVEKADVVISATTSPHLTLLYNEVNALKKKPDIIVDLAVPRDIEPSIKNISGITLLTIDDISGSGRHLSPESVKMIEKIIAEHIAKYNKWAKYYIYQMNTKHFPLFVDMNGKKALIVGGGNVAERRVKVLTAFGADIIVISSEVTEYIEHAASSNMLYLLKRKYNEGDIAATMPFLVIAATDERDVNRAIMTEAKSMNIHVSVADCREECTFYFPAIAENRDYVAGLVSKNGNHSGVKQTVEKIREALNS